jgi:ribosomal protein S6--L-glutamate ligase
MRLAILAGGDGWHVRDLRRAAGELGHSADLLDFRRLSASIGADPLRDKPGGSLVGYDAVIVRTMPPGSLEQVVFRMDLLQRARVNGVTVLNPPAALEACVDKYLATAKLAAAGLPVPPTVACQTADAALEAFASLGGDVVVKPLFGSEGRGMIRVSNPELAWRAFRTLERLQTVLYIQQFVPHPGWDLRVLVLGGRVLAAMRRHAKDDWRTNVAQGGRAEAMTATLAEEQLALRAAAAVGADFGGVDLLPTKNGHVVLEVNAVPGWRALAPACGVDVAAAVVRHLARGKCA